MGIAHRPGMAEDVAFSVQVPDGTGFPHSEQFRVESEMLGLIDSDASHP